MFNTGYVKNVPAEVMIPKLHNVEENQSLLEISSRQIILKET